MWIFHSPITFYSISFSIYWWFYLNQLLCWISDWTPTLILDFHLFNWHSLVERSFSPLSLYFEYHDGLTFFPCVLIHHHHCSFWWSNMTSGCPLGSASGFINFQVLCNFSEQDILLSSCTFLVACLESAFSPRSPSGFHQRLVQELSTNGDSLLLRLISSRAFSVYS